MKPLASHSISGGSQVVQGLAPIMEKTAGVSIVRRSPVPVFSIMDGGPMITAGVVIAEDPEFGINAGIYRLMLKERNITGIDIVHVPYKGAPPAMTDLLAGHVALSFATSPSAVPYVKSGKLRALAVSTMRRISALPDVPTIDESGVPGFETSTWFGLLAPAGTPGPVIAKINGDVGKILASSEMRERLISMGQVAGGESPEAFGRFIREEIARYAKIIKAADIPLQ